MNIWKRKYLNENFKTMFYDDCKYFCCTTKKNYNKLNTKLTIFSILKVFCSLTNSIYNSGQSEDSLNNNNLNKSEKYFSELETLYILGKHYPKPIGVF